MFERFTDRARAVVMHAQEEARQLGHDYIGTEHLLLGLLVDPEGMSGQALTSCGIDSDGVRAEIVSRIGRGSSPPKGHIAFTPRAKNVLELSLRQALKLGDSYIGTEHVLLGLLAEGEGVAAQILTTGVDGGLVKARDAVFERMGRSPEALVGLEGRIAELGRAARRKFQRFGDDVSVTPPDEVRKRLEAIEARLSVIEQLLRDLRGEEEVS